MGRADELAELVALLDAALDGRSALAVLVGEPGIGKTRLAEELAALAGARAVPVLWGGCTATEGAPPYWPWRRILRSWLAVVGPDRAAAAMAGFGEVARLAPELPGEPVESDRFALFDAVPASSPRSPKTPGSSSSSTTCSGPTRTRWRCSPT